VSRAPLRPTRFRKAYRRLAKKLHPDLNPGNKKAEAQFKEVAGAYDAVGCGKRRRYDAGEIDASGASGNMSGFTRIRLGGCREPR